jgi:hypothetical protein
MTNKKQIIGGILTAIGIVLLIITDWPLAWGAIGMIVIGMVMAVGPLMKAVRQRIPVKGTQLTKPEPLAAGRIGTQRARYQGIAVPAIHLTNNAHTIDFMGFLPVDGSLIKDAFTGNGWEIQSDPIEIFLNGVPQGMGYICDELGATVSLEKVVDFDLLPGVKEMKLPKNASVIAPRNINEPIKVRIPDEKGEGKEFTIEFPRKISVFAKFEGIVGHLASVNSIQRALEAFEPTSRTLLINRIVFTLIGAFVVRSVTLAVFHF